MAPFELFDHKADIGVRGTGPTLEKALEGCAQALTEVMVSVSKVEPKKSHVLVINAADRGALLVQFLNELLFLKDTKKMVYSQFRVTLTNPPKGSSQNIGQSSVKSSPNQFSLRCVAFGEKIDAHKHHVKVDAKAATYSQLLVEQNANKEWVAQCIIDV